jgi:putative acetyltransferase
VEYKIREYLASDQDKLLEYFRVVFTAMGFGFDVKSKHRDLCDIPAHYQSRGCFLLATQDDKILGTAAIRQIAENICELKRFYVLAGFQGRGIGKNLLSKILAHARNGFWHSIRLDTTHHSVAALSLFQKSGFCEISRYNDNPVAEIFMALKLCSES